MGKYADATMAGGRTVCELPTRRSLSAAALYATSHTVISGRGSGDASEITRIILVAWNDVAFQVRLTLLGVKDTFLAEGLVDSK